MKKVEIFIVPRFGLLISAIIILFLIASALPQRKPERAIENKSFTTGERFEYRIHVGLINAATGEMVVDKEIHEIDGRPCFRADVFGRTNGFFDWIIKIRDHWGVYIDTAAILPLKSFRYLEEGRYRKNEIVYFDHNEDTATVHFLHKQTKVLTGTKNYGIRHFSQGLISGYYFLRTVDFGSVKVGDTLKIDGFFDKEAYNFKLTYLGKEELKTKLGDVNAHILSPIMPKNSVFDGKNSVKIWLSADQNKVPLKAKAKLFFGALEVDITSAKGLRKD